MIVELNLKSSQYPFQKPFITLFGGGVPFRGLQDLNASLKEWGEEWEDRVGEPVFFEVIEFLKEKVEVWKEEEEKKVKEEEKKRRVELRKLKENEKEEEKPKFKTEMERREEAKQRLGGFINESGATSDVGSLKKQIQKDMEQQSRKGDRSLVDDLFN